MSTVIGDPRKAGEEGPVGDQRKAGESGTAGDPRPAGEAETKTTKTDAEGDTKPAKKASKSKS